MVLKLIGRFIYTSKEMSPTVADVELVALLVVEMVSGAAGLAAAVARWVFASLRTCVMICLRSSNGTPLVALVFVVVDTVFVIEIWLLFTFGLPWKFAFIEFMGLKLNVAAAGWFSGNCWLRTLIFKIKFFVTRFNIEEIISFIHKLIEEFDFKRFGFIFTLYLLLWSVLVGVAVAVDADDDDDDMLVALTIVFVIDWLFNWLTDWMRCMTGALALTRVLLFCIFDELPAFAFNSWNVCNLRELLLDVCGLCPLLLIASNKALDSVAPFAALDCGVVAFCIDAKIVERLVASFLPFKLIEFTSWECKFLRILNLDVIKIWQLNGWLLSFRTILRLNQHKSLNLNANSNMNLESSRLTQADKLIALLIVKKWITEIL